MDVKERGLLYVTSQVSRRHREQWEMDAAAAVLVDRGHGVAKRSQKPNCSKISPEPTEVPFLSSHEPFAPSPLTRGAYV